MPLISPEDYFHFSNTLDLTDKSKLDPQPVDPKKLVETIDPLDEPALAAQAILDGTYLETEDGLAITNHDPNDLLANKFAKEALLQFLSGISPYIAFLFLRAFLEENSVIQVENQNQVILGILFCLLLLAQGVGVYGSYLYTKVRSQENKVKLQQLTKLQNDLSLDQADKFDTSQQKIQELEATFHQNNSRRLYSAVVAIFKNGALTASVINFFMMFATAEKNNQSAPFLSYFMLSVLLWGVMADQARILKKGYQKKIIQLFEAQTPLNLKHKISDDMNNFDDDTSNDSASGTNQKFNGIPNR